MDVPKKDIPFDLKCHVLTLYATYSNLNTLKMKCGQSEEEEEDE